MCYINNQRMDMLLAVVGRWRWLWQVHTFAIVIKYFRKYTRSENGAQHASIRNQMKWNINKVDWRIVSVYITFDVQSLDCWFHRTRRIIRYDATPYHNLYDGGPYTKHLSSVQHHWLILVVCIFTTKTKSTWKASLFIYNRNVEISEIWQSE